MGRRQFLAALSAGTAHLMFLDTAKVFGATSIDLNPLQKVKLGNSGLETTLVGFGTGVHANNRSSYLTKQDTSKSVALLQHAYNKGIRLFDCADTYGTHGIMAEAIKEMDREEITLVSKIWFRAGGIPEFDRPNADIVIERFLKELNTDYIDLV